jgi:hypothetical protein
VWGFKSIRRSFVSALLLAVAALFTATASKAQGTQEIDTSWPREIESDLGKIIIYQPQLDSLDGNIITGRAAVSLQGPAKKEPLFGALPSFPIPRRKTCKSSAKGSRHRQTPGTSF